MLIARNRSATHHYFIEERFEAGIALVGTEVKSLRDQSPSMRDGHIEIVPAGATFEAFLLGMHIAHYKHGNLANHHETRSRKLLLKKKELAVLYGAVLKQGMTIIPLELYWKNGKVKVSLGIARGKKSHDKREDLKKRAMERDQARE